MMNIDERSGMRRMLEDIRREVIYTADETGLPSFHEAVMAAMASVPRARFVPQGLESAAFDNGPLPIGHGQTISQPYIVALMTELLRVGKESVVLEVGTPPLVEGREGQDTREIAHGGVQAVRGEKGPVAAVVEQDEDADHEPGGHGGHQERHPVGNPPFDHDDHHGPQRGIGHQSVHHLPDGSGEAGLFVFCRGPEPGRSGACGFGRDCLGGHGSPPSGDGSGSPAELRNRHGRKNFRAMLRGPDLFKYTRNISLLID